MPLIVCPDCGKEISDQASYCPNCGYCPNPVPKQPKAAACPKCGHRNWSEPKKESFNVTHSVIGGLFFGFIGLFFGIVGAIPGVLIGVLCGYNFGKKPVMKTCRNCGEEFQFN